MALLFLSGNLYYAVAARDRLMTDARLPKSHFALRILALLRSEREHLTSDACSAHENDSPVKQYAALLLTLLLLQRLGDVREVYCAKMDWTDFFGAAGRRRFELVVDAGSSKTAVLTTTRTPSQRVATYPPLQRMTPQDFRAFSAAVAGTSSIIIATAGVRTLGAGRRRKVDRMFRALSRRAVHCEVASGEREGWLEYRSAIASLRWKGVRRPRKVYVCSMGGQSTQMCDGAASVHYDWFGGGAVHSSACRCDATCSFAPGWRQRLEDSANACADALCAGVGPGRGATTAA